MSISGAQQPNDSNVYVSSLWTTRTGEYHIDVEITLPRPIIAADGYSLKMSILSLSLASTQMAVNIYTNSLTISGITATLTPGNYSATVLAAALTSLFPTRSVAFNTLTSKMTFSSATSMVVSGSMCDILGIKQGASGTGILRDVASNPMVQGVASAALGPEAGMALNGISAAAGFANQVTRAAPAIANRLDIELANAATAIASGGTVAATSATYAITGVTLDCEYITLADDAHRSICALTNNQFAWSSSQWRTYRSVHAAGQMSNAIMIPSRVTSMKSLLIAQRESAAEFDLSKCGSTWINATPVSATGTALPAYIEAVRVFSNPASESGCGLFASDSWALDTNVAPTATSVEGSFIIGVELEIAYASTPLGVNIDCFCEADASFFIDGNTKQFTVAA
ncbi:hypothetical protein JKP88DRAFT_277065 [Tribonema minus]|uniref:Uncharacterized protein n=1 Tax=Tribonema minus TaxID=303371 RepID=A0A835Z2Z8_9STRA|nr:hypothetical protein JKP88DRAFT_277065 [Tribonema minus]